MVVQWAASAVVCSRWGLLQHPSLADAWSYHMQGQWFRTELPAKYCTMAVQQRVKYVLAMPCPTLVLPVSARARS